MNLIEKMWYEKKGLLSYVLWPLSAVFYVLSSFRMCLYKFGILKSFKIKVPIIVVGNIGVGGNGKTPFVLWLVPYLQSKGLNVAVISRGYGSKCDSYPYELTKNSTAVESGDEPFLIYKRLGCPVVIGADRKVSYQYLNENYNLDVIISDDGLQHYKMPRTIEICIVDAIRKYGNGFLLPAGPLRELPSRLKTVDLVVANGGTNLKSYTLFHTGFFSVKNDIPVKGEISGEALIVSAIGNPKRFEDSLRLLNVSIKESRHFKDHHLFTKNDFLNTKNINVLMTEKDAVKCQHFAEDNWYYLRVDAKPTEHLQQAIDLLLKDKEIV